jgi:hypothetical protein
VNHLSRETSWNCVGSIRDGAMNEPSELVRLSLDGLEAGEIEIMDQAGMEAKATLAGTPQAFDVAATLQ